MLKHVLHGISISAILDRRRITSNNDYPVRILVIYQKGKKYYTTGKTCTEDEWARMPNAKSPELIEKREEIQYCFNNIKKYAVELYADDLFSLQNLDRRIKRSCGKTINELFENNIELLRKDGRIGTMQSHESTLTNINKYKGDNVPVEEITVDWLEGFESFMLSSRSITTTAINMRNIRTMMNRAKREGYIKETQYPFGEGKFVIKTEEGTKRALTFEQIKKIKKFKCLDETLMMYRDIWLFIYYCNGINIADLVNLRFSNIVDDEIDFVREKTKRTTKTVKHVKAIITHEMRAIIERWGNEPQSNNYIFNLMEHSDDPEIELARKKWFNKKFNQHLKMIGAAIGLSNLTSYSARHSYATVLKRKGANIAYISESLGHTSLNTTQIYLDSFDKEERIKNAQLL